MRLGIRWMFTLVKETPANTALARREPLKQGRQAHRATGRTWCCAGKARVSMGATHSCGKRAEEGAREHRTFDLLVPDGVSEGHKLHLNPASAPLTSPSPKREPNSDPKPQLGGELTLAPTHSPIPQPRQPTPQFPPGDELKFRTAAGPYGLRVPEGVTPGRRLQVTVTVPENFNKLLVVEGLTVNGTPIPTAEEQQRAAELEASVVCVVETRPRQCHRSAFAPPQRAPRGSGQRGAPRKRPSHCPPGCCLELSASKAADLAACDHSGVWAPRDARTDGGLRKRSGRCRGPQGERCLSLT